jgi:transcriptional regulator with XRE-family HTH domain
MDLKVFFGTNLKRYRKAKHLSQEELSEKVDISVNHLSKIERGVAFVSADLLEKLSANMGVSAARLFCGENEQIGENPQIHDDKILQKFDRITEKHLIRAMDGIKADIRRNNMVD